MRSRFGTIGVEMKSHRNILRRVRILKRGMDRGLAVLSQSTAKGHDHATILPGLSPEGSFGVYLVAAHEPPL
jgi:hypothetical protein